MADAFVTDVRAFLSELDANNSRDWFQANKTAYEARLKNPATALLAEVTPMLVAATGSEIETKLFRIHRDVRFSKDKTPYNTHLHMLWREAGRKDGPGWFLGIGLDYAKTGWGWMGFSKPQIGAWRDAIAGPDGDAIAGAVAATGMQLQEPELKKVPPPHDRDHPQGTHLRRKSLTLWSEPGSTGASDLMTEFQRIEPLRSLLDPHL